MLNFFYILLIIQLGSKIVSSFHLQSLSPTWKKKGNIGNI